MANSVIGMAAAKVNGLYRVDVKNVRYQVQRTVTQHVTQGGVKISKSVYLVSGSFEETIPKDNQFNWDLEDAAIQLYDYETRTKLIFSAEGCITESVGGQSDLAGGTAGKSISFKGTLTSKF